MTDSSQVEATGLRPFTTYNYQFAVCGSDRTSPVGHTKTAPAEDADVGEIKLAVFSCSNYRKSLFRRWAEHATVLIGD